MDRAGIEPAISALQMRRSATELTARQSYREFMIYFTIYHKFIKITISALKN